MTKSNADSDFQALLKRALDELCADHESLRVEGKNEEPVVVLSEADSAGLKETAYLLRSPENARRLLNALHGDREADVSFGSVDELRARLIGD